MCFAVKIFASKLTAHIGLLKVNPNAIKSVWESKEGGSVKSQRRDCPGQIRTLLKVEVFLGCFFKNDVYFGV